MPPTSRQNGAQLRQLRDRSFHETDSIIDDAQDNRS